jgi:antitoxin HicB
MYYPVILTPDDNDTFLVTCALLPEVTTFGETEADALQHAGDAIAEALAGRLARWERTPYPLDTDVANGTTVKVPLILVVKLALMNACINGGVSRAELARRLGWHREQVDRVFRAGHGTRLDQLDAVATALGKHFSIGLDAAA